MKILEISWRDPSYPSAHSKLLKLLFLIEMLVPYNPQRLFKILILYMIFLKSKQLSLNLFIVFYNLIYN